MNNINITKKIAAFVFATILLIALCFGWQNYNGNPGTPNIIVPKDKLSTISNGSASAQTANSPHAEGVTPPTNEPSTTIAPVPLQTGAQMESLWYYYNMLDASQKAAYLELYDAIMTWISDDSVAQPFTYELSSPGPTVDGDDILMNLKWDNPIIAQYFNTITVIEANGLITFTDTDDQQIFGDTQNLRQLIHEVEVAADIILSRLTPSMSDYDKYWEIAKKLCEETAFDYTFPQVPMREFLDESGVYGALVNRLSVCQGFSQTYDYLCKRAGLFSLVISGSTSTGDHAWNIIKLDDGYYHVDTTWMQSNKNRYFCLTDKQIAVDHTIISAYHPDCDGNNYAYEGSLS